MSSTNHTLAAQQKKVRFQCYEKWHAWSVFYLISTLGALGRPMTNDDHPIQLHRSHFWLWMNQTSLRWYQDDFQWNKMNWDELNINYEKLRQKDTMTEIQKDKKRDRKTGNCWTQWSFDLDDLLIKVEWLSIWASSLDDLVSIGKWFVNVYFTRSQNQLPMTSMTSMSK